MGLERKLCSWDSRCRDEFQTQECKGEWSQKVVYIRICQASLAIWSRKLDHQRTGALMSSAVLRPNDRTSVNGNTRRSGDKSGIRDATARFKQFGHTVRRAEIRGTERFGHWDREGTTRKQAKVSVSQERAWRFIHRSHCTRRAKHWEVQCFCGIGRGLCCKNWPNELRMDKGFYGWPPSDFWNNDFAWCYFRSWN